MTIQNTVVKKGDWVTALGVKGIVERVSKSGEWADVKWRVEGKEWKKRTITSILTVLHTITVGDMEITDLTRKMELEGKGEE